MQKFSVCTVFLAASSLRNVLTLASFFGGIIHIPRRGSFLKLNTATVQRDNVLQPDSITDLNKTPSCSWCLFNEVECVAGRCKLTSWFSGTPLSEFVVQPAEFKGKMATGWWMAGEYPALNRVSWRSCHCLRISSVGKVGLILGYKRPPLSIWYLALTTTDSAVVSFGVGVLGMKAQRHGCSGNGQNGQISVCVRTL